MGPQAHPYGTYPTSPLGLAVRLQQQQQHTYTDLLLKSYENHLAQRFSTPTLNGLPPGFYPPGALPPVSGVPGMPTLTPYGHIAGFHPGGSFQNLLAAMGPALAAKAAVAKSMLLTPSPLTVNTEPPSSPNNQPKISAQPTALLTRAPSGLTNGLSNSNGLNTILQPGAEQPPDRRSSSIAALRMKAREYEMKLQLGQNCKGIVY